MNGSPEATCPHCHATLVVKNIADQLAVCAACGEPLHDGTTASRLSAKAQFTMMLGILSVVFSIVAALPALLLGAVALREIHRQPDRFRGKGLAIWGMCLALAVTMVNGGCVAWVLHDPVTELYAHMKHVDIVPTESRWTWWHPADGVDPETEDEDFHSKFYQLDYDDSHWTSDLDRSGPNGGFGYGDAAEIVIGTADAETLTTAYFRHRFSTNSRYSDLSVHLQRDDGVIIYLDGVEVARDNMFDGPEAFDLLARTTVSSETERAVQAIALPSALSAGEHVLAISLHNRGAESSDLRIGEISLRGRPLGR